MIAHIFAFFAMLFALLFSGRNADAPAYDARDLDILARTIWGEARGEGSEGMQAVANVIMNRYAQRPRYGSTVRGVCQRPYQFSCWNAGDPNRLKVQSVNADDPQFKTALEIAAIALSGTLADITGGANHYHADSVSPSWAAAGQKVAQIGVHEFYKLA